MAAEVEEAVAEEAEATWMKLVVGLSLIDEKIWEEMLEDVFCSCSVG